MAERESNRIWALVGKISAVATLLATLLGIGLFVFPSGPKLTANVTSSEYQVTPSLQGQLESVYDLVDTADPSDAAGYSISWDAARALDASLSALAAMRTGDSTLLNVSIVNNGNRVAERVALSVPGVADYSVHGGEGNPQRRGDTIELGSLRPGTSLVVYVWTNRYFGFSHDEVTLTHNAGRGKVTYPIQVGGPIAWLANNDLGAMLVLGVASIFALIVLLKYLGFTVYQVEPDTTDTTSEPVDEDLTPASSRRRESHNHESA